MNPLYYCSSYWPHNSTLSRTHTYLHLERGELFFRKTWEIIENRYFIPFFLTCTSSFTVSYVNCIAEVKPTYKRNIKVWTPVTMKPRHSLFLTLFQIRAYLNAFKNECVFSVFIGRRSFECYVRYYPKTNTNNNNTTITNEWAQRTREMSSWTREERFHIYKQPSIIFKY